MEEEKNKKEETKKEHPLWFKDAKWISGIILFMSLASFFLIFNAYTITQKKNAVPALGLALALNYSRTGLDDPKDINEIIRKAKRAHQTVIQPISSLNIKISLKEIEGKSPREIRLLFFNQVAEKIYDQDTPNLSELGFLAFVNKKTNASLYNSFIGAGIVSLFSLVAIVLFSRRFGKIAAPAITVLLAVLPQMIFWSFLSTIVTNKNLVQPNFVPEGKSMSEVAGYTVYSILGVFTNQLARIYLIIFAVCLIALFIAILLRLIFRKRAKPKI